MATFKGKCTYIYNYKYINSLHGSTWSIWELFSPVRKNGQIGHGVFFVDSFDFCRPVSLGSARFHVEAEPEKWILGDEYLIGLHHQNGTFEGTNPRHDGWTDDTLLSIQLNFSHFLGGMGPILRQNMRHSKSVQYPQNKESISDLGEKMGKGDNYPLKSARW